jgi:phage gp36-like protein
MLGASSHDVTSVSVSSQFIADAESFVDAYIGARYVVPLSYVPPLITQITSDLAIFNLAVEKLPRQPDFMKDRYDRSVAMLEQLRDGKMVLTSVSIVTSGDQEAWSPTEGYHPVFSPVLDELDQRVDKDSVEADIDEREDDCF